MTSVDNLDTIPVAPLKIISLDSFKPLADKVDKLIVTTRKSEAETKNPIYSFPGYVAESYLVDADCPRFSSGEAKGILRESVHGTDLFILADVVNNNLSYGFYGIENRKSPDDQFQDLKRMIDACNGKAHRITVIIPFLYESRQDKRTNLESLDCATALQELLYMGVKNIVTFDAHDPRIANAIPISGFDNFYTSYQFIQSLLTTEKKLSLAKEDFMVVSPDEGGMSKAVFYANILGVDMGMFYKRRDYSTVVNGKNPIVAHEFLGTSVEGKSIYIMDDMIASGQSVLEVAAELKKRKADKIYIAATFGLFTEGYEQFDKYYEAGLFDRIYTTNLTYCSEELMSKPYYANVDISRYLALIIHTINHDKTLEDISNPKARIQEMVREYKNK